MARAVPDKVKKKAFTEGAWQEARELVWKHRKRLAFGLVLMLINRLSGLVLPTTTKYLMDDVISQGHWELLPTLVRRLPEPIRKIIGNLANIRVGRR